jgi:hypothetical protein
MKQVQLDRSSVSAHHQDFEDDDHIVSKSSTDSEDNKKFLALNVKSLSYGKHDERERESLRIRCNNYFTSDRYVLIGMFLEPWLPSSSSVNEKLSSFRRYCIRSVQAL